MSFWWGGGGVNSSWPTTYLFHNPFPLLSIAQGHIGSLDVTTLTQPLAHLIPTKPVEVAAPPDVSSPQSDPASTTEVKDAILEVTDSVPEVSDPVPDATDLVTEDTDPIPVITDVKDMTSEAINPGLSQETVDIVSAIPQRLDESGDWLLYSNFLMKVVLCTLFTLLGYWGHVTEEMQEIITVL